MPTAQVDIDKPIRKLLRQHKARFGETYSETLARFLAGPKSTHHSFHEHTAFERDILVAITGHQRDRPHDGDGDGAGGGVPCSAIQDTLAERLGQRPTPEAIQHACRALVEDGYLEPRGDAWVTTPASRDALSSHLEWIGCELEDAPADENGEKVVIERRQVGQTLDSFTESETDGQEVVQRRN
jgi:hypothetical protein